MRKTYQLEIEAALDAADEHQAIQIAREHYRVGEAAEAPVDEDGQHWREIPAEEFVPDAVAAIMELIDANELFAKAGIEVTGVSFSEPLSEELSLRRTKQKRAERTGRGAQRARRG